MNELEQATTLALQVLKLIGAILAIILVMAVLLGIVRSTWRVARMKDTLVLPFYGGESAGAINRILAEQLTIAERYVRGILKTQLQGAGTLEAGVPATSLDVGPFGSPVAEFVATLDIAEDDQFIVEDNANLALDSIEVAGVSFSPTALLGVAYQLRSRLAKRTICGSHLERGDTTRIVVSVNDAGLSADAGARGVITGGAMRRYQGYMFDPLVGPSSSTLTLVENAAFRIVKARIGLMSGTNSWNAYVAFSDAYNNHTSYLESGDPSNREAAVDLYQSALAADPMYPRASYNLASLLYDRYTLESNQVAIDLFRRATRSSEAEIRAMAYAGVTFACCQNVDRFKLGSDEWVPQAAMASNRAAKILDIAETRMARAWFLQITKRYEEAVAAYLAVLEINDGREPANMLIRSFALNNAGWICMAQLGDLTGAERLVQQARSIRPNKNIYAVLGELYRRQRKYEAAIASYEDALALDPYYVNGLNELAMVYLAKAVGDREDPSASSSELARAFDLHHEALSLLSDPGQRAAVGQRFDAFRRSEGLSDDDVVRFQTAT